eukprot:scaffold1951_cov258-Pinguiococcus_pyrenoidosus.AAC.1
MTVPGVEQEHYLKKAPRRLFEPCDADVAVDGHGKVRVPSNRLALRIGASDGAQIALGVVRNQTGVGGESGESQGDTAVRESVAPGTGRSRVLAVGLPDATDHGIDAHAEARRSASLSGHFCLEHASPADGHGGAAPVACDVAGLQRHQRPHAVLNLLSDARQGGGIDVHDLSAWFDPFGAEGLLLLRGDRTLDVLDAADEVTADLRRSVPEDLVLDACAAAREPAEGHASAGPDADETGGLTGWVRVGEARQATHGARLQGAQSASRGSQAAADAEGLDLDAVAVPSALGAVGEGGRVEGVKGPLRYSIGRSRAH